VTGTDGDESMDLTENTLWWLKQAFYFSLTEVNESVK
jgi:hypothetical protein